jgi:hypothetical protein
MNIHDISHVYTRLLLVWFPQLRSISWNKLFSTSYFQSISICLGSEHTNMIHKSAPSKPSSTVLHHCNKQKYIRKGSKTNVIECQQPHFKQRIPTNWNLGDMVWHDPKAHGWIANTEKSTNNTNFKLSKLRSLKRSQSCHLNRQR